MTSGLSIERIQDLVLTAKQEIAPNKWYRLSATERTACWQGTRARLELELAAVELGKCILDMHEAIQSYAESSGILVWDESLCPGQQAEDVPS